MLGLRRAKVVLVLLLVIVIAVYFLNKLPTEQKQVESLTPTTPLSSLAVVVPHHDVVKQERQEFWAVLLAKQPDLAEQVEKIFIISPDHFGQRQDQISFDAQVWQLRAGEWQNFLAGKELPREFREQSGLVRDDHGLINLVAELYANFPGSQLAPFLLGQELEFEKLALLGNFIKQECQASQCLLVGSVDFSHYLPEQLANLHDLYTQKKLLTQTIDEEAKIEVDSPQTLYLLQEFAKENELFWWRENHTNAARGSLAVLETTSHFMGAFLPPALLEVEAAPELSTQTYFLATNLDPALNQETFGVRLFYGADVTETQLAESLTIQSLTIFPAENQETFFIKSDVIAQELTLGADYLLAVEDDQDRRELTLFFYPLIPYERGFYFVPFEERVIRNEELFARVSDLQTEGEYGTMVIPY